jgi:hypothetical protein
VDLPGDPLPGDPDTMREVARRWRQLAEDSEIARMKLQQLLADDAVMSWLGQAGDAFRAHAGKLPDQLAKCAESYGLAADAVWWWSGELESCQADADRALALGRQARLDLNAALLSLASAEDNAASAARYVTTLDLPPGAGATRIAAPDPTAITVAVRRAAAANDKVERARGSVVDAQERLDAAKRLVADAVALREQQGREAGRRIRAAADAGIPPDSFWHKVSETFDHAWHIVVQIAQVVVIVGSIAAIVCGGPLAWVVIAAAAIVLTNTIVRYLDGQASLWDTALAALACIPLTPGLASTGELRGLLSRDSLSRTGLRYFSARPGV